MKSEMIKFHDRIEWRLDGRLHREDGPAVEWIDGDKLWYLNGKLHRIGSPAVELANGNKYWYLNGLRHRVDGPAMEWRDGTKEWYFNGILYSKEIWFQHLNEKEKVLYLFNMES